MATISPFANLFKTSMPPGGQPKTPGDDPSGGVNSSKKMSKVADQTEAESAALYEQSAKDGIESLKRKMSEANIKRAGAGIDTMGGL